MPDSQVLGAWAGRAGDGGFVPWWALRPLALALPASGASPPGRMPAAGRSWRRWLAAW